MDTIHSTETCATTTQQKQYIYKKLFLISFPNLPFLRKSVKIMTRLLITYLVPRATQGRVSLGTNVERVELEEQRMSFTFLAVF